MSQQEGQAVSAQAYSEEDVATYLLSHPDFFDRHADLLMGLKVAHQTGGAAISLVERQVGMLRQRNAELERRLKDLVAVAKLNDALVQKIHDLALAWMTTGELKGRLEMLETSLREDFRAERAVLVLFSPLEDKTLVNDGFLKVVERDDGALKPFASFLKAARPRCGLIRDRQKTFLFEGHAVEICSAALIPLGTGASLGFLVIGSQDPDYFHPGKGMEFLSRLGELVSVALIGRSEQAAASGPRASGS